MVQAGGSASRTIGDRVANDPGGGVVGSRRHQPAWQLPVGRGVGTHWTSIEQAFPPLGATPQRIVDGMNESCWTALKGCWEPNGASLYVWDGWRFSAGGPLGVRELGDTGRGMRPAGGSRPFPQRKINDLTDERDNTAVRPLSVEAEEFSLGTGPKNRVTTGAGSDGGGDFLPSRTGAGSMVIQCDAAVSTAAEAGAAALADIAGGSSNVPE